MNILNPIKVPTKIYRWDDKDAPKLDKSANCMQIIFKACLATGYGNKPAAGWTSEYDNVESGITILRPKQGAEQDFYLRLSADTGTEVAAQIYTTMSDADTGALKLQCATPFKYAKNNSTGKWLLIATDRSFWFFCEQRYFGGGVSTKAETTGAYFFAGDTAKNTLGNRGVFLIHSGGNWNDGDFGAMTGYHRSYLIGAKSQDSNFNNAGRIYDRIADNSFVVEPLALFNGLSIYAEKAVLSPFFVSANGKIYQVPGLYIPAHPSLQNNFDTLSVEGMAMMVMSSSGGGDSNCYIVLDWEY